MPSTAIPAHATRWPQPRPAPDAPRSSPSPKPARDLTLPESVDLAYCRFLLMHVLEPLAVLQRMVASLRTRGLSPRARADHLGRTDRRRCRCRCPRRGTRMSEPSSPGWSARSGLELVDAWAEAPAGAGPGPVATYLERAHRGRAGGRLRGAAAPRHGHRPPRRPGGCDAPALARPGGRGRVLVRHCGRQVRPATWCRSSREPTRVLCPKVIARRLVEQAPAG